jgi:hypothetical protein
MAYGRVTALLVFAKKLRLQLDGHSSEKSEGAAMKLLLLDEGLNQRLVCILAMIAIVLGVTARVVHFGSMPPGLNQDEASIGYETWSLLHYGIDRNGMSWPVHFIAWGSGQNALYAYVAIPFVAFGLSPLTVRLPMLLSALVSLWLIWLIADRLFDRRTAWGAAAIAALCPWHIMLARWGLESNVLPFIFLCGFACLVVSQGARHKAVWLSAACAFFGLSLYAYGTAYLAVPTFLTVALLIGALTYTFTLRQTIIGFTAFALTASPIALFVAINTFGWHSLVVAGITIPRLPVTPRFQSQLAEGPAAHVAQLWHLLSTQSDGMPSNVADPYGVLYSSIFFVLAIGLAIATVVFAFRGQWPKQRTLLAVWLIAALPIGMVQEPNINRINLLLMNLVVCAGLAVSVVDARVRGTLLVTLTTLLVLFGIFTRDYFTVHRDKLAVQFFDGLLPALQYAQSHASATDNICLTEQVQEPYIYALFSERTDPREYLRRVQYTDPTSSFRHVTAFGRYTIGLHRCAFDKVRFAIARDGEIVPKTFSEDRVFGPFSVYTNAAAVQQKDSRSTISRSGSEAEY